MAKIKQDRYWNHQGKNQGLYDRLFELLPKTGEASMEHLELLRVLGRLGYDHYNNGRCNYNLESFKDMRHWFRNTSRRCLRETARKLHIPNLNEIVERIIFRKNEIGPHDFDMVMDVVVTYADEVEKNLQDVRDLMDATERVLEFFSKHPPRDGDGNRMVEDAGWTGLSDLNTSVRKAKGSLQYLLNAPKLPLQRTKIAS